jgi:surface antigen
MSGTMGMIDPTDDRVLVAYADGELGVMEAIAVEAALERDPMLQARLADLRDSAALLRSAYGPVVDEAVPAHLRALVEAVPVDGPVGASSPVSSPANDNTAGAGWAGFGLRGFMRVAAAVALVLAGAAGGWVAGTQRGPARMVELDSGAQAAATMLMQRSLENLVSGASDIWRDPQSGATLAVTPVRTFKDSDDRYCREYRETLSRGGEQVLLRFGVACRDGQGRWNSRFHVVPGADPPEELAH